MGRKAFLAFNTDGKGKPTPHIYYDQYFIPEHRTDKNHSPKAGPFDISHYVGPDGEVTKSFAALTAEFLPLQMQLKPATTPVEEGKYQMAPKPATGFLASDGKFFHTAEECDFYEHTMELGNRIKDATAAVAQMLPGNLEVPFFLEQVPSLLHQFVTTNEDVIHEYIRSKRVLDAKATDPIRDKTSSGSDAQMDGQTSKNPPFDDTSVRDGTDTPMDTTETAEAESSRPRKKPKS